MTIKLLSDTFNKTQYNSVVTHPLQSWEWGEARKKMGIEIARIGEFEGNALNKACLLTFHKIPFTKYKIGYIPRSYIPSKPLVNYLTENFINKNIVFIKLEPYITKTEKNINLLLSYKNIKRS